MVEQPCAGCRQVWTTDGSGLCEDCQTDVISERPGSMTVTQHEAVVAALIDIGYVGDGGGRQRRIELLTEVIPGWQGQGDIMVLSQRQAGDVLERIEELRMSQEARRL